jgi:osmoprotectant transport system substrate-binding protein
MLRKFLFGMLVMGLIWSGFGELPIARACAGYTLSVGTDGSQRQELLAQIMSELVRQRTGTKIRLVRFKFQAELLEAAKRKEVDLLVVVTTQPATVKNDLFLEGRLRLLKPFGYQDFQVMPAIQTETLKRFPALQRLINRLAGIIDDATLLRLEEELAAVSNLRAVAKKFLTEQNLVFGS